MREKKNNTEKITSHLKLKLEAPKWMAAAPPLSRARHKIHIVRGGERGLLSKWCSTDVNIW